MAISKVGREIVLVVMAAGTAGTGITVTLGVGEAVGDGAGVGAGAGVGLADAVGVESGVAEIVGVGVADSVSVGVGVGLSDTVGGSGAVVAPVTGTAAPAGTDRIRLPTTAATPAKPTRLLCAFAPRMGVAFSLWVPVTATVRTSALRCTRGASRLATRRRENR
jgi:hypothetical protein